MYPFYQFCIGKICKLVSSERVKLGSNCANECRNLAGYFLGACIENNLIWQCNLKSKDAMKVFENANFWKFVVNAWCKLRFTLPQSKEAIRAQLVWFNSEVKSDNEVLRPLPFPKLFRIGDLLDNEGCILEYEKYCKNGTRVNWLHYKTICATIPPYWRTVLSSNANIVDCERVSFEELIVKGSLARIAYHEMNDSISAVQQAAKHWNKTLSNFEFQRHLDAFKNLYLVTNVAKLRNFQYRLLHNKIFCNNVLYYWGKTDSQKCEWCNTCEKQEIMHLLFKQKLIWFGMLIAFCTQLLSHSFSNMLLAFH